MWQTMGQSGSQHLVVSDDHAQMSATPALKPARKQCPSSATDIEFACFLRCRHGLPFDGETYSVRLNAMLRGLI